MDYQDNLALYLNLSRKELQALCKKNNLPANRSTTQLAKSVASYLKRKASYPSPLNKRPSNAMEASSCKSYSPDTKTQGEPASGEFGRTINSPECDADILPSIIKEKGREKGSGDMPKFDFESKLGNADFMGHEILDKPCDSGANTFQVCISNNVSAEVFGCSSSVRNTDALHPSGQPRLLESSTKVGFLSSSDSHTKSTPSFEFFVMSNEGINLYIDLDSSPSNWIKNLKDEVRINQKMQHQSSMFSASYAQGFSDPYENMKPLPLSSLGLKLHSNDEERNTACTNSSLSSFVSPSSIS
ncbi:hypothetical protein AXF42_Ash012084 [Apostasia shenzhenica]|uniref:SAP domain-containing protein n=1 Tax=Apostasia shenzhenica TaxID=1088818 RepID=A0A2I0AJQ0_9ASPA|nr:hypothetical protein AXF42_Ash012084 [Apostasia shenzhenica]